jgi:hypothetical protein
MIETLKQTGMIVVLMLLFEKLFVFRSALGNGESRGARSIATMEFVAGATLCSSGLMLLYSLRARHEE